MASTQRPKFRTTNGCCICRRKSSSSRFAPSFRWEKYFDACFKLNGEIRSGLICNACVLIVKRFKAYLPTGQDATWSYVVDCRLGPGTKNMSKIKKKMSTGPPAYPYRAIEQGGIEFCDMEDSQMGELAEQVSRPVIRGKSRRTTVLFSSKMKKECEFFGAQLSVTSARKAVQWTDLVRRRVKVPPHIPSLTHSGVEGYHTCCGIIYISPDCSKIWAQREFFHHCQRLHPIPGKFGKYQEDGCVAFAARISQLHSEISSRSNYQLVDTASCVDEFESACSPSTVTSDAGVEVSSEGSARSTAADSLEFSEHDDFGTAPSSPASVMETVCEPIQGLYQSRPYALTVTTGSHLSSHHQLPLSVATIVTKAHCQCEA